MKWPYVTAASILIIIAAIFYFYSATSADLVMVITPTTQYLHETENTTIELTTNTYLHCEARCEIKVINLNDSTNLTRFNATLRDAHEPFSFITPVKENKILYGFEVVCANKEVFGCPAYGEHRARSLISTVETINESQQALIQQQKEDLAIYFARLAEIDAYGQLLVQQIGSVPEYQQRAEYVLSGRYLALQQGRHFQRLWNERNFEQIQKTGVPIKVLTRLENETKQLEQDIVQTMQQQHELISVLEAIVPQRERLWAGYAERNGTEADEALKAYVDLRRLSNNVVRAPTEDVTERLAKANEIQEIYTRLQVLNTSRRQPSGSFATEWKRIEIPLTLPDASQLQLESPEPRCCLNGTCTLCTSHTPIMFVHGHSMTERNHPAYSLEAFAELQQVLEEQGIVNAGVVSAYDAYHPVKDAWNGFPVSVAATYYYDAYLDGGSYIFSSAKSESIDTYAIRLRDAVHVIQERTGSDEVIIVAHSMGGLVARRYMQLFGSDKVQQLITIGTPHHGVTDAIAQFCPVLGANKECDEMRTGSSMLAKINDPRNQPDVKITAIVGRGCDDGDGIVTEKSATLEGATTIYINGTCQGTDVLHTSMLNPDRHPIDELLLEILSINLS